MERGRIFSPRDVEIVESIRRDDLAYILGTRYEKPLKNLLEHDTHPMLLKSPSPMMVAAFYGATKCFEFFLKTGRLDYEDDSEVDFLFIVV